MKITSTLSDATLLDELGQRVRQQRVGQNLTQAQLADAAGISARTIERFESGNPIQLDKFVRVLRVLRLSENLDLLLPENELRPLQLIGPKAKPRQRASSQRLKNNASSKGWTWGDMS
jgi:transcriptional regulator with XRE-family HTH domain